MNPPNDVPHVHYGVVRQNTTTSALEEAVEQVKAIGYAVLDAGYSAETIQNIALQFDLTRDQYLAAHGAEKLRNLDEYHTIRSPLTSGNDAFLALALNPHLLTALQALIQGQFVLNQQNGIVNPPGETYNQAAWHRDLPYQHFTSSSPLAINALYCVDDFTADNGATYVLPASHKTETFPSPSYIKRNAIQVEAKAGSYLLLDCMLFHTGGFNRSGKMRRAVNHVFNIPFFKQQIKIPGNIQSPHLTAEQKKILGFDYVEPQSVVEYLNSRVAKKTGS